MADDLQEQFRNSASDAAAGEQKPTASAAPGLLNGTSLSTPARGLRQTLAAAWKLARPYLFKTEDRYKTWTLLAGIGATMAANVGTMNWLNNIQSRMWDSLKPFDPEKIAQAATHTAYALPLLLAIAWLRPRLVSRLQQGWRHAMGGALQKDWLQSQAYYGLPRAEFADNASFPEQRLHSDVADFTYSTIRTGMSMAESAVMAGWFSKVFYDSVTQMTPHAAIAPCALALWFGYTTGNAWIGKKIAGSLNTLWEASSRINDSYVRALSDIGKNAEAIALSKGEEAESAILNDLREKIRNSNETIGNKNSTLDAFFMTFGTANDILPMLALGYMQYSMTGGVNLEHLRLASGAASTIERSVGSQIFSGSLAEYQATVARLTQFQEQISAWKEKKENTAIRRAISTAPGNDTCVAVHQLTLKNPETGATMIAPFDLSLAPGDRMVISGQAGCGKTTLFRALGQLWDCGEGAITLQAAHRIMSVPQKSYLPSLNLRGIICYPEEASVFSDDEIRDAMTAAGLEAFLPELDNDLIKGNEWSTRFLSGGQPQLISFARIFLHKPDILMLDEVTSSLDPPAEARLYKTLIARLPDSIILSIAHRETVHGFHNRHARIIDGQFTENDRLSAPAPAPTAPRSAAAPAALVPA